MGLGHQGCCLGIRTVPVFMKLQDSSYRYCIEIWDPEKIRVQYGFAQYRHFSLKFAMI